MAFGKMAVLWDTREYRISLIPRIHYNFIITAGEIEIAGDWLVVTCVSPVQSHLYDHRYSFHPTLNNIHTNIHKKKRRRKKRKKKERKKMLTKIELHGYRLTILIKIERIVRNVHAKLRVNFWIARSPRFIHVLNKCLLVFFFFIRIWIRNPL